MNIKKLFLLWGLIASLFTPVFASENTPAESASQTQQAEKKSLTFNIWEFQVSGNTMLDQRLVERSVYGFLGPNKTIDDVDAASNALQTLYKDNGYPTVLVHIPQQDVSSGIVKLDIIQGTVDRLKISGSRYFSLAAIRKKVPSLAVGEVPHLPTVQAQLQSLNTTNTDLRVTPIFRPGKTSGTVFVELKVKDDAPLHGSIEVNGRNSAGTTRSRLVTNLSYANLWLKNHNFSLTYQTSPEDTKEVQVLVGSYVMPVGNDGDRLAMYMVNSNSKTGVSSGGALSVVGKGFIAGARWVKPLKGEQKYLHSLVFGIDHKDFDEIVGLDNASSIVTPIKYTMFSLDYNATMLSLSSTATYSIGVKFAPRAFGNNSLEFENKRFNANPNFSIINASFRDEFRLDNGVKLLGAVAGQFSNQPLISNEQFSIGGAETVRGYFESQVLADDAAWASVEIQSPDFTSLTKYGFRDAYLKAFIDGGVTRIHQPLVGTDSQKQVSSAGIGLRLATSKNFRLDLDVASPFQDNNTVKKGDIRIHFLLRGAF